MESDWGEPEPFQYMMGVENGWVHGLEWSPDKDTYEWKDLQNEDKTAETILKASEEHEYTFEYSDFSNDSITADKVGIDAVNGIIDVHEDGKIKEQYSLVAILENDQGRPELVFGGLEGNDNPEDVYIKTGHEIDWSPELAAAYEAFYERVDIDRDLKEESVPLYDPEEEKSSNITTLNDISAKEHVKRIDEFIRSISDPAQGLADFEDEGEITIEEHEHYGKAKGFSAARDVKTHLNRLRGAGLIDYTTESLNKNGDEKEVDLKIAAEFLDGDASLDEDVAGLSDFDIEEHEGREKLIEERMS